MQGMQSALLNKLLWHTEKDINLTEDEVIESSLWQATIYAAFQRAKVYETGAENSEKKGVKKTLKKEINKRLSEYANPVTDNVHVKNIAAIAKAIDKKWSKSLDNGSIPIGVVQKAFNLYLKLMWCLGIIPEPPHCPLDKVIIDMLPCKHRKSWTKIRDIKIYKALVKELVYEHFRFLKGVLNLLINIGRVEFKSKDKQS